MPYFRTYNDTNNRLVSWYNVLTDMTKNVRPFTEMCARTGDITETFHRWPLDELAAATSNAQVEGATPTYPQLGARTYEANYTQIWQKSYQISDTKDAIASAGVKKETTYQRSKKLKELLRDQEYAYLRNTAAASGADSSTARQAKGIQAFVTGNTAANASAGYSLREATLLNQLQNVWDNSDADTSKLSLFVGSFTARVLGGWVTSSRPNAVEGKTISSYVEIYQSPYGTIKVVKSPIQRKCHAYIVNSSTWKRAILRPVNHNDTPKTGSFKGGWWETEETLMNTWNYANAKIISCASA